MTVTIRFSDIKVLVRWMLPSCGRQLWIRKKRILLRVNMDDDAASELDMTFDTLMGDRVEPRREFIEANAKYVQNLDI